jgi:malate dehydrogenase (oxaloacetate-decarboxylating)(NADP+)
MTPKKAREEIRNAHVFGCMMVREGEADGLVCGLNRSYPDTIRPALQVIGMAPGAARVSGVYMLALERRVLFFADATVNIEPDARTLAEIAVATGRAVREYFDTEPRVAMLSFSNFGSVDHDLARRSAEAVRLAKEWDPTLVIDGEMAADTALVPEVGRQMFPMSAIQGDANVLVFPDLQAGNIAYKLVQHLANAELIGPVLVGLGRPVNVLNHYSSVDEIVNIAAITVIQAAACRRKAGAATDGRKAGAKAARNRVMAAARGASSRTRRPAR